MLRLAIVAGGAADGELLLLERLATYERQAPPRDDDVRTVASALAALYEARGKPDRARCYCSSFGVD